MAYMCNKYKLGDIVMYNGDRYRVTSVRRTTTSIPYTIWDYEYNLFLDRDPREGELSLIKGVNERAISRKVDDIYDDLKKGKELLRLSKECIKYDRERPEFLPEYRNIPTGLEQSLNKLHDNMINSLLYSVPTFYMAKEEMNAMFGVPKFECKKIIFNGPCTIILWKDGTKTIAKASDGEMFDPEKGVAICFMKRALGETEGKKVLRKVNKQYEDHIIENGIQTTLLDNIAASLHFVNPISHVSNINPNSVICIDQSTIEEVKKVEEQQNNNLAIGSRCSTCKYYDRPMTEDPCSYCISDDQYKKREETKK